MFKSPVDDISFDCTAILQDTQEWAMVHGLLMYSKVEGKLTAAPYSLFPSPWPRRLYNLALTLATDYNLLIDKVAQDTEFLLQHLEKLTEDQFTTNLVKILKTVNSEGVAQKVRLGIHRSDYMVHTGGNQWELKQVELNTIAASFSNLSTITNQLHKFIVTRYSSLLSEQYSPLNLATNESQTPILQGLATAFKLYNKQSSVIVMIVHPNETNTFDQRILEFLLWEKHNIKLLRRSLLDINERAKMNPTTKELIIDEEEVAVVYFRAGYTPDDYPTSKEWDARLLIERSLCIKNPSVSYHLAGTKKIQQVLALPGVLEKFLDNKESIERIRNSFMGLYSLTEGEEGVSEIISKAKNEFTEYVMKPQREGGGNNIYNIKIKESLENMSALERSGYILMDKIKTPKYSTIFIRNGELKRSLAISELGIYSVFICDDNSIYTNTNGGYLLRTKVSDSDEGGVAAGYAVLDSLYLTEE